MFEKTRHRLGTLRAVGAFVSWRARGAYLWFLFAKLWGATRQVRGLYSYRGYLFDLRPGTVDRLALHPTHERETRRWLTTTFASSEGRGVFLDVGAHCGTYAIPYEDRFRSVIALEPSPSNCAALRSNIELNRLGSKISTVQAAAGSQTNTADFFLADTEDKHSLLPSAPDQHRLQVGVTTLDRILVDRKIAPSDVRLVKIDVEGVELDVLRGAGQVLHDGRAAWVIEVNDRKSEALIAAHMKDFGYRQECVLDGRNAIFCPDPHTP